MVVLLKRLKGFVSAIISHIYKNGTDGNGKWFVKIDKNLKTIMKDMLLFCDKKGGSKNISAHLQRHISTTGWSSGIYVISANKGNETATCKIFISK